MDTKYIGEKIVDNFTECPEKTPLGANILNVVFTDGTTKIITERAYKNMLSPAATDATALRDLKCKPVCQEILALMAESNLTLGDISYVMQLTAVSIDENASKAVNKLFKVEYKDERSLLAMNSILQGNEPDVY